MLLRGSAARISRVAPRHRPIVPLRGSRARVRAAVDPAHLASSAQMLLDHVPLLYEPVAAPCSLMNCGDVIHRRFDPANARLRAVRFAPAA